MLVPPIQGLPKKVYGLREFLSFMKEGIEGVFPDRYWVVAEVGRLNRKNGHLYFELTERDPLEGGVQAKCQAILYKRHAARIESEFVKAAGIPLEAGLALMLKVCVSFHPVYGFTLVIEAIDSDFSVGQMVKKRRDILLSLETDGLLQRNKALEFPLVPLRLALITSSQAAGFQDFLAHLQQLNGRFPLKVVLYEALMQGRQTKDSILLAMRAIEHDHAKTPFDVVVIVRGGGAVADLHWFDDLKLARAVALCPIPVLCGIGHEIDRGVLDAVAHTAVKTPTDAANHILTRLFEAARNLEDSTGNLNVLTKRRFSEERARLSPLPYRLQRALTKGVRLQEGHLSVYAKRVSTWVVMELRQKQDKRMLMACHTLIERTSRRVLGFQSNLSLVAQRLSWVVPQSMDSVEKVYRALKGALTQKLSAKIALVQVLLQALDGRARMYHPENLLKRGFTITLDSTTKKPLKSRKDAYQKRFLVTRFVDGELLSEVVPNQHDA
jgi:exodeoxyribonuclease VII large subunit